MNNEGAKNEPLQGGKESEKEEDAVLPSRSTLREPLRGTCLRGLIIPMQSDLV